jgi:hypothetical protein
MGVVPGICNWRRGGGGGAASVGSLPSGRWCHHCMVSEVGEPDQATLMIQSARKELVLNRVMFVVCH